MNANDPNLYGKLCSLRRGEVQFEEDEYEVAEDRARKLHLRNMVENVQIDDPRDLYRVLGGGPLTSEEKAELEELKRRLGWRN